MTSLMMSSGTCTGSYKGPCTASLGVHSWFISPWVRRYTCMHRLMCWRACIARAYFLKTYLIALLSLPRKHPPPRTHYYTPRIAWEHRVLVPSLQDHCAFRLVPVCTVCQVVKLTSLEACCCRARLSTPHYACHNYWHPWVGAN